MWLDFLSKQLLRRQLCRARKLLTGPVRAHRPLNPRGNRFKLSQKPQRFFSGAACQALTKLGVPWEPTEAEKAYVACVVAGIDIEPFGRGHLSALAPTYILDINDQRSDGKLRGQAGSIVGEIYLRGRGYVRLGNGLREALVVALRKRAEEKLAER